MKLKIRVCLLLALLILSVALTPVGSMAENDRKLGDVDNNGNINAADAATILRYVIRLDVLDEVSLQYADVDLNDNVTAADAAAILRFVVHLDTLPPQGGFVPPPPPDNQELAGKVIILDPGHGYDSVTGSLYGGRMSDENGRSYAEADRVLEFALQTKDLLEEHGATVILTRHDRYMTGNYTRVSLSSKVALEALREKDLLVLSQVTDEQERKTLESRISDYTYLISIMDEIISQYVPGRYADDGVLAQLFYFTPYTNIPRVIHPDTKRMFEYEKDSRLDNMVFISLHTNASASSQAGQNRGLLVYCVDNNFNPTYYDGYQSENSIRLGLLLNDYVSAQTGLDKRRDSVQINDFFMLRENNLPSVLLEIGYHDNSDDLAIISDAQTPQRVANGILLALKDYFSDGNG